MEKPHQILELEQKLDVELFDWGHESEGNQFKLNELNEIIGLKLIHIGQFDLNCLNDFINLKELRLTGNEISEISSLKILNRLEILDLDNNDISDFSCLLYLPLLNSLDLSRNSDLDLSILNKFSELSILSLGGNNYIEYINIESLTNLISLNLAGCSISDLSFLTNLRHLNHLNLSDNPISNISILSNLRELTSLNLANIDSISNYQFLGDCFQLKNLTLSNNQISDISFIDKLTNLTYLNLSQNRIIDISCLKNCQKLWHLEIWQNQISDISIIKNLVELVTLEIWSNEISDLSALKFMKNLIRLDLYSNNLNNIEQIKGLYDLEFLDLSDNQIRDISPLSNLTKLKSLNLQLNKIADLRPIEKLISKNEIYEFEEFIESDYGICIENNPLNTPSIEVIEEGQDTIIQYFDDAKKYGLKALNECKVILLGDGGLGKTSLMKQIKGLPFSNEETTHGINKLVWDEIINENKEHIKVNLWDFGGQHIQHSLHQFFLNERVIYILLLDPRNDTKAMYWLEQIDKLGKDSEILIVYNWKDVKDKESHSNKNFYELRKSFPNLRDPFLLSCKEGDGFDLFKKELISTIRGQKELFVQYPLNWFGIKEELEKDVTINKNYISYVEYDNICAKHEYQNELSKRNLLKQLNKIGSIVFFDKPILNDLQVLNPDWITTGAYSVITSKITSDKKGHLTHLDLQNIFNEEKTLFANEEIKIKYKDSDFGFIMALMIEYDLCVKNPFSENEFLIPCAFEGEKPKEFEKFKDDSKHYRFKFESSFEMLIMYRFMARNFSKCLSQESYWQSGILLKDISSETTSLVETNQHSKIIDFWIKGENIREFWGVLRRDVKEIVSKYDIEFEEQVLYEKTKNEGVFLSYDEMIRSLQNGFQTIDYHPTFGIKNINVFSVIENFEDTKKLKQDLEHGGINIHGKTVNIGDLQHSRIGTQTNFINHYYGNAKLNEVKELLEEFEYHLKKDNEWKDVFGDAIIELYRLEEANEVATEKKSVSKLQKFFTKAKEVKDWVAIGSLPVEIATKGNKLLELGEELLKTSLF